MWKFIIFVVIVCHFNNDFTRTEASPTSRHKHNGSPVSSRAVRKAEGSGSSSRSGLPSAAELAEAGSEEAEESHNGRRFARSMPDLPSDVSIVRSRRGAGKGHGKSVVPSEALPELTQEDRDEAEETHNGRHARGSPALTPEVLSVRSRRGTGKSSSPELRKTGKEEAEESHSGRRFAREIPDFYAQFLKVRRRRGTGNTGKADGMRQPTVVEAEAENKEQEEEVAQDISDIASFAAIGTNVVDNGPAGDSNNFGASAEDNSGSVPISINVANGVVNESGAVAEGSYENVNGINAGGASYVDSFNPLSGDDGGSYYSDESGYGYGYGYNKNLLQ